MSKTDINPMEEDRLIQAILKAKGKKVEIIAFGILYTGVLAKIDIDNGTVVIKNGETQAMLEIERIESFCLMPI